MSKIAVVMSTYNGEKFLHEQLDSILCQINVEVDIFVRDDGSSDNTCEILRQYANANRNIFVDLASNVGVGNSFMNALYSVPKTYDYYAFADQDDIWHEDKLIQAVTMLQDSGKALYASNQENVDKNGESLGMRYDADEFICTEPIAIISKNKLAGCTMVFTNDLFCRIVKESSRPSFDLLKNRIHDVWVAAAASVNGGIIYDDRSFIKYRQHDNNVVGAYSKGLRKNVQTQISKVFRKKQRNGRSLLAKELIDRFDNAAEFPLVADSAAKKRRVLLKNGKKLRSFTGESSIGFFIKVVLSWY